MHLLVHNSLLLLGCLVFCAFVASGAHGFYLGVTLAHLPDDQSMAEFKKRHFCFRFLSRLVDL